MKRVQFLISPTGAPFFLAYNAGEFASVPDDVAEKLVQANIAILAPEQTNVELDSGTVNIPEKKATPAAQTATSKKTTEKR